MSSIYGIETKHESLADYNIHQVLQITVYMYQK